MTELEAKEDLHRRGVWQIAPGLWADKSTVGLIGVPDHLDNALSVREALEKDGSLPPIQEPL